MNWGVRYVLEGSVRKSGKSVRVAAQLIDAATGAHLWADRFDRTLTDVFAVQDEITTGVASRIEPTLSQAELRRALARPITNMDVWELYQRGLWHLYKYTPENHTLAKKFFHRAIEADPHFAAGHHGSALSMHFDFWLYSPRHSPPRWPEVDGTVLQEAKLAVSLDDQDFMGHAVLSFSLQLSGQWEASVEEAQRALTLNSNNPWSVGAFGHALGWAGCHEEGIKYLRQAMRVKSFRSSYLALDILDGHLSIFFQGVFGGCARNAGGIALKSRPRS